jgi:hypothetical protein
MKPPIKTIIKELGNLKACLAGKYEKYADMSVREVYCTIAVLELLLEEEYEMALDIYYTVNWSPDMQLDYKIVDFLSQIYDSFQDILEEISQ